MYYTGFTGIQRERSICLYTIHVNLLSIARAASALRYIEIDKIFHFQSE